MPHTVIIGAGPIGLYLAYQLKKAKIKDLVIYDPRAGLYVRPGHVNREDFIKLQRALGKSERSSTFVHIKDFERTLFEEITRLGIPAERKKFIRFQEKPQKGVVVQDIDGVEEIIECDYVFDCTGSQRLLVNNLNSLISPPPFTIKFINDFIKVKQHLLAYVHIGLWIDKRPSRQNRCLEKE